MKDKGIFIKNIYYMLCYAFQVLREANFENIASEKFENIQDLFAAILAKGVSKQLKQGLHREYILCHDILPVMRGKLDISESFHLKTQRKQKLSCEFDELSENNLQNQILKTTMYYLNRDTDVSDENRKSLNKVLLFFNGVSLLEPHSIDWSHLYYQRNNRNYELLLNVCYFILNGMIQTEDNGKYKMGAFSDEHMSRLYERFILEYYKQHHTYFSEVKAAQVKWDLIGENDETSIQFLPLMKTDIFLRLNEKILILDAKYYGKIMQVQYDKKSLRSAHLYQIFTYVKNYDNKNTGNVSGILIYAKTGEDITPDYVVNLGGNQIGAKTLDLNKDFKDIANQLDSIAEQFFGKHEIIKKDIIL